MCIFKSTEKIIYSHSLTVCMPFEYLRKRLIYFRFFTHNFRLFLHISSIHIFSGRNLESGELHNFTRFLIKVKSPNEMDFVCEMREMHMMPLNKQTNEKKERKKLCVYQCSIAKQKPILATVSNAYKYKRIEQQHYTRLGTLFM